MAPMWRIDSARKLVKGSEAVPDNAAYADKMIQVYAEGDHANTPVYLTISGDVYTKDDNAYILAEACGGQEDKDCSCVECDGGWFNATNFRFKYVDADGAEKEVNVTSTS